MRKEAKLSVIYIALLFVLIISLGSSVRAAVSWNESSYNVTYPITEDVAYSHNFTINITIPQPGMTFKVDPGVQTPIIWNGSTVSSYDTISYWIYFINVDGQDESLDGIFLINATSDNQTGNFSIPIRASHGGQSTTVTFNFSITAINDAPRFVNLANQSFNRSTQFNYQINITDEENNIPFVYNITFLNCTVANWSNRDCNTAAGRELFNISNTSEFNTNNTAGWINISLTPSRNDVGNYTINFIVIDSGNTTQPNNASRSQIVLSEVLNINEHPYFLFVCDSDQTVNATEDTEFQCYINATDVDEINNLTFEANYTWFNFSTTNVSSANISGLYNFSAQVKINATDIAVGNWTVNISLTDTGSPTGRNSTILSFYIANKNDSVTIANIPNEASLFTSENKTIYINATDDDLLIPDTSVYDEDLTFSSNNSNVSLVTSSYNTGTNRMTATFLINTAALGSGTHNVNISVTDSNGFSIDSDVFAITISDNNRPYWEPNTPQNHTLTEDLEFFLNLSLYGKDDDGPVNFSYINYTRFDNFRLNATTGIVNFTPRDIDVGFHNMTIIVNDSVSIASLTFNFTVSNINDSVNITDVVAALGAIPTGSLFSTYTINATEDNATQISVLAVDNDFNVTQPSFYNESILLNYSIQGPNTTLLSSFTPNPDTSVPAGTGRAVFTADFTPGKNDVGQYNITINVTDRTGNSDVFSFNLTIIETDHEPNITSGVSNQIVSILNETVYMNLNATDLEDGDETSGNLTYVLTNLTLGGNFLRINSSTGIINLTTNATIAGLWQYQVTVNDTTANLDTEYFNVTIYDYPQILLPLSSNQYNLVENQSYQLNFSINHTVQDTLNYTLIINGQIRNSTTGNGNATAFLWSLTPTFLDETTCTGTINLTLNVSNSKLSNSSSWNLTINHTNYPLVFNDTIDDYAVGSPLTLTLSDYFVDIDASDSCVNQSVSFTRTVVNGSESGGSITVTIENWINASTPEIIFASSTTASANYSITATEYNGTHTNTSQLRNATSNNFSISLTSTSVDNPTVTSGGGGGSDGQILISLKIIVPEPVSAKQKDKLIIPLGLFNDGDVELRRISLSALIAKDGLLRNDLIASFDRSFISSLKPGQRENVTLIVDVDTSETGIFEVTINGTVEDPDYSDWAKLYIEIEDEFTILERIIFTEEFVIGNPVCAEFKDLIDEAKEQYNEGRIEEAVATSEKALDSCKQAISQPPRPRIYERIGDKFFTYAAIASLGAFGAGFIYYYYRRVRLRMQLGYPLGKLK